MTWKAPRASRGWRRSRNLEDRYGFRSAWNLPLDQYPIDWTRVEKLRAQGFEFGAHGLRHDGMLFRSRKHFEELAPRVEAWRASMDCAVSAHLRRCATRSG